MNPLIHPSQAQAINEAFANYETNGEGQTLNYRATILNMGVKIMKKDEEIAKLKSGQKGQLKKEIAELKAENELYQDATKSEGRLLEQQRKGFQVSRGGDW